MWEDTAERREASLRERKAQMILAARQYVQSSLLAHHYKLTACSLGKANASRTTDTSRVPCRITTWVLSCLHARFLLARTVILFALISAIAPRTLLKGLESSFFCV